MPACRVSQDELNNDYNSYAFSRVQLMIAKEQMERVSHWASMFLNGHNLVDERKTYVFDVTELVKKPILITFGIKQIAELVAEKITPDQVQGLYRGEPQALFQMQKLIGDCAQEVAFEALDLESNPFVDLNDLKDALESL